MVGVVDHREGGVGHRQHERVLRLQHAVDLAEHPVDVLHRCQPPHRQDRVDRVGSDERQLGERGVVQLHLHLLALARGAGVGDLVGRLVDADHLGALLGQRDGVVPGAAAEVEDALALDVTEELQRVLARDVGAVGDDVGREVVATGAGDGEASGHRRSLPGGARLRW